MRDIMTQNIQDVLGRGEALDCAPPARLPPPAARPPPPAAGRTADVEPPRVCCGAAVSGKSEKLRGASKNYVSQGRYLNTQALLRKYGPLAFVLLLVLGMLWWRFR